MKGLSYALEGLFNAALLGLAVVMLREAYLYSHTGMCVGGLLLFLGAALSLENLFRRMRGEPPIKFDE